MDVPGTEVPSTSAASSSGSEGSMCTESSAEEPKCRKSSRLKAKMSRQSQESVLDESGDTYNLRLSSLVKRVQVERRQSTPKQPKGKSKPPPLSKYRRRTANARERMRMKEINEGFERLRQCLPEMEQEKSQGKKKENPTKLTILNLALNYIHALRDILGYSSGDDKNSNGVVAGPSEESDLGSNVTSPRTLSVSSASCDEMCSNSSPDPSLEQKDLSVNIMTCNLPKELMGCHDPLPSASAMMEFRGEARSSPTSSDPSLPPSPPSVLLPEECMDLDHTDLLDVSISLAALEGIEDIV